MRRHLFVLLTLFLMGCATRAQLITGPDGRPHYLISCDYGIQDCYERARETCEGNYQIVNTSQRVSGVSDIVSTSNDLLVKCTPESASPSQPPAK